MSYTYLFELQLIEFWAKATTACENESTVRMFEVLNNLLYQ